MKRFAVLATIVVAGLVAGWIYSQRVEELTMQRIADRLYVIFGDGGNTAVFIKEDGVVLVDTKGGKTAQRILELVRTVTDKPITHILNTHTHNDHVGGNPFFPASVEIVAHANTAARMKEMAEFADPAARHGLPDRIFRDRFTIFEGRDAIEMFYFGPAHTDGDAFFVFQALGAMHAGDTFPGPNAIISSGGSAADYPRTMARAAATIKDVHTVIPGHAPVATWRDFLENVESLQKPPQGPR